jgi:sporulation protein YlmC with PRC-barrel domain
MLLRHRGIGPLCNLESPMANNDMDRVVPLGQLDDFKVADGDPDVRGWEVLASDGRKIGEVDELLVDTNAMKVRYLDVDVDDGVIGDDRHVLIPIGYARLERDRDCVMVDGLASADLHGLPAYGQGPLTRDFETSVRDSFSQRGTSSASTGVTEGMMGAGMIDTAGLDNTPGAGTGIGLGTNVTEPPVGEGMRAAGYDLDSGTTSPLTGSTLRDTGSTGTGLDSDLGTTSGSMSAGSTGGTVGGGGGDRLSAGATSEHTLGSGGDRLSASGGTFGGSGNAPLSGSDDTLIAGAGSQGPVSGMGTDRGPQGDTSHRAGLPASDYQHNADEDFYASDAFDDGRFYGSRRPGDLSGDVGGGPGTGGEAPRRDSGGLSDSMGASAEETHRLAQEGMERLREDQRNRGVGDAGQP